MLQEIIGNHPVVSNNHRLLAKFHSGMLRIVDMRLMFLFSELLLKHLLEFVFSLKGANKIVF